MIRESTESRIASVVRRIPDLAVGRLRRGEMLVLAESAGRGHGIMVGVAALLTAQNATLMAVQARGLLSITVDQECAFRLGLRRMPGVRETRDRLTEYLVSIEGRACEGTGISAHDRALTIRSAGAPDATQHDLVMPGHIVPLLVMRPARADASLPEIAHLIVDERCKFPVAAWCHILNDQGDVASFSECRALAQDCGLGFLEVESVREALSRPTTAAQEEQSASAHAPEAL